MSQTRSTPSPAQKSGDAKSYFDLHTTGIGHVQRVREVAVTGGRRAQPFLACTIAAFVGPAGNTSLRYFDVKVSGADAKTFVQGYLGVDDPKKYPLVKFRLGDLWVQPYLRKSGEHQGQAAASLKGRLLKVEPISRAAFTQVTNHELITRGIGYLNRIRDVQPEHGEPFLACSLSALTGPSEDPEYRYFETIVTHPDAQHLIRRCVQAVQTKKKVLLTFHLDDMQATAYLRTKGEHAGQPGASLDTHLIHISMIKVNGEEVYRANPTLTQPTSAQAAGHATATDNIAAPSSDTSSDATAFVTHDAAMTTRDLSHQDEDAVFHTETDAAMDDAWADTETFA